jgi:hypothetical protein
LRLYAGGGRFRFGSLADTISTLRMSALRGKAHITNTLSDVR